MELIVVFWVEQFHGPHCWHCFTLLKNHLQLFVAGFLSVLTLVMFFQVPKSRHMSLCSCNSLYLLRMSRRKKFLKQSLPFISMSLLRSVPIQLGTCNRMSLNNFPLLHCVPGEIIYSSLSLCISLPVWESISATSAYTLLENFSKVSIITNRESFLRTLLGKFTWFVITT